MARYAIESVLLFENPFISEIGDVNILGETSSV